MHTAPISTGPNPALPVICLAGPTGCGKTAAALALARELGGEVVNADSRQVYADFPLITAQPSPEERAHCPHYLYGFLPTDEKISAGRYAARAENVIRDILARGKTPLLVGGTGLYFQALLRGMAAIPPVDASITAHFTARVAAEGPVALHAQLTATDPEYAARIHPNDRQRIIRALEVFEATGRTFSRWHAESADPPLCRGPLFVLNPELRQLEPRLSRRLDMMLESGALDEAKTALARCPKTIAPGWSGIGAAEARAHLEGHLDFTACRSLWLHNTRAYAKRQLTWFRARSESILLHPEDMDGLMRAAQKFWAKLSPQAAATKTFLP